MISLINNRLEANDEKEIEQKLLNSIALAQRSE